MDDIEGGDDPVGLRVALVAVGQAEPFASQLVENLLTDMAERRMPQVVRTGGGPHHRGIADVFVGETLRCMGEALAHLDGDRMGNRAHLQRMGQTIVHDRTATGRADHLGDRGQPGVERREPDALQVNQEWGGFIVGAR